MGAYIYRYRDEKSAVTGRYFLFTLNENFTVYHSEIFTTKYIKFATGIRMPEMRYEKLMDDALPVVLSLKRREMR
jgi:hypothetical protein